LPEVKGRLLNVLLTEQNPGWFASDKEQDKLKAKEANQRAAIAITLSWISNEGDSRYRQYEETLIRCNDNGTKPYDTYDNGQAFWNSHDRISTFFARRDKENASEERTFSSYTGTYSQLARPMINRS